MNVTDVPPLCTKVEPINEVCCMLPAGHTEPHDSLVGIRWATAPAAKSDDQRITDLILSYELKVQDLARETLRTSTLSALAWRLFETLEVATAKDEPAWTKSQWHRFLTGGFPPDERKALLGVLWAHGREAGGEEGESDDNG